MITSLKTSPCFYKEGLPASFPTMSRRSRRARHASSDASSDASASPSQPPTPLATVVPRARRARRSLSDAIATKTKQLYDNIARRIPALRTSMNRALSYPPVKEKFSRAGYMGRRGRYRKAVTSCLRYLLKANGNRCYCCPTTLTDPPSNQSDIRLTDRRWAHLFPNSARKKDFSNLIELYLVVPSCHRCDRAAGDDPSHPTIFNAMRRIDELNAEYRKRGKKATTSP